MSLTKARVKRSVRAMMETTERLSADASGISRAAALLGEGRIVAFPTETVYGIAASAASDDGIAALRAFKGRPDYQPFTVHLPDSASATPYVGTGHPLAPFALPDTQAVPAMSRCAHAYLSVNRDRKHAAVMLPASRPPILAMSAKLLSSCFW